MVSAERQRLFIGDKPDRERTLVPSGFMRSAGHSYGIIPSKGADQNPVYQHQIKKYIARRTKRKICRRLFWEFWFL
jgi:hypothetical protein